MQFDKWFNKLNRLVQIILLLIPVVGWVIEILVRLSILLNKKDTLSIVMFIVFLLFGWFIQFVDLFVVLFTGHLLCA